jgi:hypothetical protein
MDLKVKVLDVLDEIIWQNLRTSSGLLGTPASQNQGLTWFFEEDLL